MPDPELQSGTPEGTIPPADDSELSAPPEAPLGEEFKPYSDVPWDQIPEESRPAVLEGVKKLHGGLSRNQTDLKRQLDEHRQKAVWFDELTAQPWFRDAYLARNQKQVPMAPPDKPRAEKLAELGIDRNAVDVLGQMIEEKIQSALNPFSENLSNMQRALIDRQATDDLARVRQFAIERNLPSPDGMVDRISQLIQSGEARSVEAAYRIAVFDDALSVAEKKGRKTLEEELQRKSAATVPPYRGPSSPPGEEQFSGRDGVVQALRAALAESAAQKGRSF